MRGKRLYLTLSVLLVLESSAGIGYASHDLVELRFPGSLTSLSATPEIRALAEESGTGPGSSGEPSLPWIMASVSDLALVQDSYQLRILAADTIMLTEPIAPIQPDLITSDTVTPAAYVPPDPSVYESDIWYPSTGIRLLTTGRSAGQRVSTVSWCPFRYNAVRGLVIVIRRAVVVRAETTGAPVNESPPHTVMASAGACRQPLNRVLSHNPDGPILTPGAPGAPSWVMPADPPLGIEYVVITRDDLSAAVRPLVRWKARRGISSGIATVGAITAAYPSGDAAQSIREYLKLAYQAGLNWVVLAGDETVVPIRLAYAGYSAVPTDPYQFQICDLYYAELDGDWDADGDGIYGEYFDDEAELTRELFVGRLPASDSLELGTIIAKIIDYESGPENSSYLTRTLAVCADQMRDWGGGIGQHRIVAESMPSAWTHNENTMVESPSGASPSPAAPDGQTLLTLLANGYGWVNYYVHGRADGIIVRASGYSDWPKSYVWTSGSGGDGHGHLNEMAATPFPGIHLSIGCNHGGFDMDSPPFPPGTGESVAERLLFTPLGGAVAFIGQSRWGWVSSSYRIIQEFYRLVNTDSIPNHVGVYHASALSAFPQYRDLNYGNNLYGDPEMPAWKESPKPWTVTSPTTFRDGEMTWTIDVTDGSGGVADAMVTVAIGDSVWYLGRTDGGGHLTAIESLPAASDAVLTVSRNGYGVFVDTVPHSMITGVFDDESELPRDFTVLTNHPNPFNPSTQLVFGLARPGPVRLSVFDILGRRVATLIDDDLEEGIHHAEFLARDTRGRPLSSGIYLARLETTRRTDVRKLVLLR